MGLIFIDIIQAWKKKKKSNDPSGYLCSSFTFTYKLSALEVELKYMYVKIKKKGHDFVKQYENSLKKQKMHLSYDCNPTLGHISGEKKGVKKIHVYQFLL